MSRIGPFPSSVEIGILAYPGSHEAAILGMIDLPSIANRFAKEATGSNLDLAKSYRWTLGEDGLIVREDGVSYPHAPTVLIIPGRLSGPLSAPEAATFSAWLRDLHRHGTTLASSCAGSFLIAQAGLLDGRPASTHWADADEFSRRFQKVRLEIDEIIVEDGDIITAGGLMAWTDLGMRLCKRIFGTAVMMQTSRFMLVDTGGREQRNYKEFQPKLDHGDDAILSVQHLLAETQGRAITVPTMSEHAKLEERTFLRRFKSATGLRPTEYISFGHFIIMRWRYSISRILCSLDMITSHCKNSLFSVSLVNNSEAENAGSRSLPVIVRRMSLRRPFRTGDTGERRSDRVIVSPACAELVVEMG